MPPPPPPPNTSTPHLLVVPFPVQSHVSPMLQLSHFLASKSLRITFVLPRHAYARAQHAAAQQHTSDGPELFHLVGLDDGLPLVDGTRDIFLEFAAIHNLHEPIELLAEENIKKGLAFTCILTDPMVPWAKSFSRKFAIAYTSFCVCSATGYGAFIYAPALISKGISPLQLEDGNKSTSTITLLPGFPKLRLSDLPGHNGTDPVIDSHKRSSEADWILVHSVYEIEKASIDAMRREGLRMLTVGPAVLFSSFGAENAENRENVENPMSNFWAADKNCLSWLGNKQPESVVYASFGSVISLPTQELHELALGLENCGHPFLWVLRPKCGDEKTRLEEMLPEGFMDRIKDRGLIVSWASQLRVLSDPAVGGFFFQFGWSSALESISMGVPMMGWPVFADNPMNCRVLVDECGVALECKRGRDGIVERGEVERVVRSVMEGEEGKVLRRKVKEMKGVAWGAVRRGGSTHNDLEMFVEDMKRRAKVS